jgi:hypothetical protein
MFYPSYGEAKKVEQKFNKQAQIVINLDCAKCLSTHLQIYVSRAPTQTNRNININIIQYKNNRNNIQRSGNIFH